MLLERVASSVDQAFSRVALKRGGYSSAEDFTPTQREDGLRQILELYDERLIDDPARFFETPRKPEAFEMEIRPVPSGIAPRAAEVDVYDARWPSRSVPFVDELAPEYQSFAANRRAAARLFLRRGRARPVVILIHGYLAGQYQLEQRFWPTRWFLRRGIDVALAVLPFHGVRGRPLRPPHFPSSDPRVTIEGFRQSISDLRGLRAWLEDRGAPAVGVMGMSLGGYTAALWATLEPKLSFVVPFIPLASIPDFARERGRLTGTARERALQHHLLQRVFRVVSPLSRPAKVPKPGRLVLAGAADRITPIHHAKKVAEHLDAPLRLFSGGHLIQLGRSQAWRELGVMLRRIGLLD